MAKKTKQGRRKTYFEVSADDLTERIKEGKKLSTPKIEMLYFPKEKDTLRRYRCGQYVIRLAAKKLRHDPEGGDLYVFKKVYKLVEEPGERRRVERRQLNQALACIEALAHLLEGSRKRYPELISRRQDRFEGQLELFRDLRLPPLLKTPAGEKEEK